MLCWTDILGHVATGSTSRCGSLVSRFFPSRHHSPESHFTSFWSYECNIDILKLYYYINFEWGWHQVSDTKIACFGFPLYLIFDFTGRFPGLSVSSSPWHVCFSRCRPQTFMLHMLVIFIWLPPSSKCRAWAYWVLSLISVWAHLWGTSAFICIYYTPRNQEVTKCQTNACAWHSSWWLWALRCTVSKSSGPHHGSRGRGQKQFDWLRSGSELCKKQEREWEQVFDFRGCRASLVKGGSYSWKRSFTTLGCVSHTASPVLKRKFMENNLPPQAWITPWRWGKLTAAHTKRAWELTDQFHYVYCSTLRVMCTTMYLYALVHCTVRHSLESVRFPRNVLASPRLSDVVAVGPQIGLLRYICLYMQSLTASLQ